MQAVQIEMFPKSHEWQEQETFINALHHDAMTRGGFFAGLNLRKNDGETKVYTKWAKQNPRSLMTTDDSYNRYIALNTYHCQKKEEIVYAFEKPLIKTTLKRDTHHLHAITSVYLDLDFHDGTMQEIETRVENTKELLNYAYENKSLPYPTMITSTGRGLGIFYVLDRSIANVDKAEKQIKFWEYICKEYAAMYKELLEGSFLPQLDIDSKVVAEKTRVVRLPGTVNLNTGTVCKLINHNKKNDGTSLYYSLKDLAGYIKNYHVYEDTHEEIKKKEASKKIVNLNAYNKPYLVARLNKLKRAQSLVREQKEGSRELLCFYYYNTAVQIMKKEDAVKSMMEFNNEFRCPLKDKSELENIIRSVSKAKDINGNVRGYYEIKDAKILENLGLSEAQNEYVGFCQSLKAIKRKEKKEENQERREERNRRIAEYVMEHTEQTYEEIAGLFDVSLRTLKNILKEENVHRYQINKCETSICAEEKNVKDNVVNIVELNQKKENEVGQTMKVQKNAPESIMLSAPRSFSVRTVPSTTYISYSTTGVLLLAFSLSSEEDWPDDP